jgi:MauM/NapG family ferredoxin protein
MSRTNRRSLLKKGFKFGSLFREAVNENIRSHHREREERNMFRPPGAIAEKDFLQKCTRCSDCVEACPYSVIFKHFDPESEKNQTPILTPNIDPCRMCDGFPCITACGTGALVMPENPKDVKIGRAEIMTDGCLTWLNSECGTCLDDCPTEPKALVFDKEGRVRVRQSVCNGCGACEQSCPMGNFAIKVVPIEREPIN